MEFILIMLILNVLLIVNYFVLGHEKTWLFPMLILGNIAGGLYWIFQYGFSNELFVILVFIMLYGIIMLRRGLKRN
ncbi:hypothetical protein DUZ99_02670 [Xylanibacillus composti]|nr:hypothetical protein [Xylanibacillus composti]MDT9723900.1 hypothetical protein [Xylanibacillus composti]